jgi:5-methylcytosine-specific restriction endonuclease McrA
MEQEITEEFNRLHILLEALGIEASSFLTFAEWALSEQLVEVLANSSEVQEPGFFSKPDALKRFRNLLRDRTGRNWSIDDLNLLFNATKNRLERHFREPLAYGEYLKLLWTSPHYCVKCGNGPPQVKLHVDHIIPASLGGGSSRYNIQFLCQDCNLRKSNKREGGEAWLDLL